jgi:hypothetical protein
LSCHLTNAATDSQFSELRWASPIALFDSAAAELKRYTATTDLLMPSNSGHIPEHESGLRRLIADAEGRPYDTLRTLGEARTLDDATMILEGDFGGQIYVVARVERVCCSEDALRSLLGDIDALEWNEPEGANIFYERHAVGETIRGGMGGAVVSNEIWTHPTLTVSREAVVAVLAGERARIAAPAV